MEGNSVFRRYLLGWAGLLVTLFLSLSVDHAWALSTGGSSVIQYEVDSYGPPASLPGAGPLFNAGGGLVNAGNGFLTIGGPIPPVQSSGLAGVGLGPLDLSLTADPALIGGPAGTFASGDAHVITTALGILGDFALASGDDPGAGFNAGLVITGSENFINDTGFALVGAADFLNVAGSVPDNTAAGASLVMSVDGVALSPIILAFSGPLNPNLSCSGICTIDGTGTFTGAGASISPFIPVILPGAGYTIDYTLSVFADPGAGISGTSGESTVPEPASLVLLGSGLAGLAGWQRWRRINRA